MASSAIRRTFISLLCLSLVSSQTARAEALEPPRPKISFYKPKYSPETRRQFLLPPLFSLLLPGTDQFLEGQFKWAGIYLGVAAGGLALRATAEENVDHRYKDMAMSLYFTAGGLSLYHSFRTAVETRKPYGEFEFLKIDETPTQLLLAPFHYQYLERLTTLVPLTLAAAFFFLADSGEKNGDGGNVAFGDLLYAGSIGTMAGISEEAIFRGWMLPVAMHYTGSEGASTFISATAFGLGHGLRFKHFVTAFVFGLYSGWLSIHNDWTIGEGLFIHSWWDVMAFLADYAHRREHAFLKLPTLHIQF